MGTGGAPKCAWRDGGIVIGPRGAGLQADDEEEEDGNGLSQHTQQLWKVLMSDFHNQQSEAVLLKSDATHPPWAPNTRHHLPPGTTKTQHHSVFSKDGANPERQMWVNVPVLHLGPNRPLKCR